MYENIIVETGDGIELITLNRPQVLNALNIDTVSELRDAFEYARDHDEIGVVIIRGAGDRAFAAGQDIAEMQSETPAEGRSMIANGHALMREIEMLPKPVIAAVNGYAFGGGFELALACDIRIAADNAVFAFPEPSLGVIPG
ncbi:MAG: enoyl-CoA hydratase/isomerase family protein, partial [Lachnospiraceae bacterium]|nr:enoyl-CoA hydratase/isomerase family protein [Lachnospiraceae bacterium]